MGKPKATIIIPTFNRPGYLSKAVASALEQDYQDLEVIIADNASSDETRAAAERYAGDPRVKYVRNAENIGMYPNWHKALYEHSSGEWVLVLSDDDYLTDSSFISEALTLAASDPGIVLVHANYRILDEATGRLSDVKIKAPRTAAGTWYFLNNKKIGIDFLPMTALFRPAAARGFLFFDSPELMGCDSADFLRLSLNGKVGFVDRYAGVYRVHGGNELKQFDLARHLKNLGYIELAHQYALKKAVIGGKDLARWRRRLLTGYLNYILITLCATADAAGMRRLYREIRSRYPFALALFFYPANIVRLLTFRSAPMFAFLRRVKHLFLNLK